MPGALGRALGLFLGAAGATGLGAADYLLRRPLPQTRGRLAVRGLNGAVEIARDRWGVPHVRAGDLLDAFFGQGFCHAQDRLWQMDLNRRAARGRLSELFGRETLALDQFSRRVGFARAAQREWEQLGAEERCVLDAYTAGVNAAVIRLSHLSGLPMEYRLLRIVPRPWEALDSLAYGRLFAASQSPNWESEIVRSQLIARVGSVAAAAIEGGFWDPDGEIVPPAADWGPTDPDAHAEQGSAQVVSFPGGAVASNAWAVTPERSVTGSALLANDPHVLPSLPTVFYEAHLVGGAELNVVGATLPGAPGVVIGHNRHIAWGVTASMADVQDLYVERLDPTHPYRTEFEGRWEPGTVCQESIRVRGQAEPYQEEVFITARHGPLVTPTPALPDEHRTLALRSTVLEGREQLRPLLGLNRATDWDSFREAARTWCTPVLSLVYADAAGNIGWQVAGQIPTRAHGQGLVPSPGWTSRHEWTGSLPFDSLPSALNPPSGQVVSANQDPAVSGATGIFVGREFPSRARYDRIEEVLESRRRHSAVDFAVLQADVLNRPGKEVAELLVQHLESGVSLEQQALESLRQWDGRMDEGSVGATVYDAFRRHLPQSLAGDDAVGKILEGRGLHPIFLPLTSFYHRQSELTLVWLRRWVQAGKVGEEVPQAFARGVAELGQKLGRDVSDWRWGRVHRLRLRHALSTRKPLSRLFDLGPFSAPGDGDTVRANGALPGQAEAGGPTAGYRLIATCGDWDACVSCVPAGQSGHRASPHYADQMGLWLRAGYHPLPFTRPAVDRLTQTTLTLEPG